MTSYTCTLPIKLKSLNVKEHWAIRSKENKKVKKLVFLSMLHNAVPLLNPGTSSADTRVDIVFTRYAARPFDFDNLVGSLKFVRDACAEYLIRDLPSGKADDDPRLNFHYIQEKGKLKEHSLKIDITFSKTQSVCW